MASANQSHGNGQLCANHYSHMVRKHRHNFTALNFQPPKALTFKARDVKSFLFFHKKFGLLGGFVMNTVADAAVSRSLHHSRFSGPRALNPQST